MTSECLSTQKMVLITGASSGIGAATAQYFTEKNWQVLLLGRNEDQLKRIAESCLEIQNNNKNNPGAPQKGQNHPPQILVCDLTKTDDIQKTIKTVEALNEKNPLEALVNNSGIYIRSPFVGGGMKTWRDHFETNLFGHLELSQGLLPFMMKNKKGALVNVSSTFGLRPSTSVSAYNTSKAAMNMWTQCLAMEMGPFNIRVNAICPGIVDTPIHPFHSQEASKKEQTLEKMKGLQPLGRVGQPKEIAKSIYFLCSDESPWTTGALLPVDGGISLT